MPIYRHLQTSFWQDNYVLNLTSDEKYFYLYLLTNSKTKQCGIYEMPIQIAELETGFNKERIIELIKKFEKDGKIQYSKENSEIMITNWIKYNWSESSKVKTCVIYELKEIKNKEYVYSYYRLCEQYGYSLDIPSEIKRNLKIKEKRKIKETEKVGTDLSIKPPNDNKLPKSINNDAPIKEIAEHCYMENGKDCELKQTSTGLEQKCYVCFSARKYWQ